ncbi:hypothetical protein QN362_08450 [Actimicrobium sp. CCC2.4]|uniref:hypothetical protein n=1 Tax=Actimicrobium sp. CCC2.4 TaxID=3048606 RepID=UPI002AC935D8|nr:hypothetical protein [Actimicrobium sp. CCC2.4]MEB0135362.1 hypothetical protein [Actimicrobium sp. CCC2.4]WPX32462.1 hypothetical protein RHM62_01035 [Actimicrobium sp. CCC2.4]
MNITEMEKIYIASEKQLTALNEAIAFLHQDLTRLAPAGNSPAVEQASAGGVSGLASQHQQATQSLQRLQQDRTDLITRRKTVEELISQHHAAARPGPAGTRP